MLAISFGALGVLGTLGVFWTAEDAYAEIYKYTKRDGSIVYTEDLGELPRDRQAYYRSQEAQREERRRALEARVGSDVLKEREAEQKRKAVLAAELEEAERQRRLAALDELLKGIRARRLAQKSDEASWRSRIETARTQMAEKLKAFGKTQEEYNRIAVQASYTLLPGQADKKKKLKETLDTLEKEIDALVIEIEETIPDEARKAGVPPGWIR